MVTELACRGRVSGIDLVVLPPGRTVVEKYKSALDMVVLNSFDLG